jgi:hypothetical protein
LLGDGGSTGLISRRCTLRGASAHTRNGTKRERKEGKTTHLISFLPRPQSADDTQDIVNGSEACASQGTP